MKSRVLQSLFLFIALLSQTHADEWIPPENRTSLMSSLLGSEDPFSDPQQKTREAQAELTKAGGQYRIAVRVMNLVDRLPGPVFEAGKRYQLGEAPPFTLLEAFKASSLAWGAVLEIAKRLEKDEYQLGKERSASFSRGISTVFPVGPDAGSWPEDLKALRQFCRSSGKSKTEAAFHTALKTQLEEFRVRSIQCAAVGWEQGAGEIKTTCALFLRFQGYVVPDAEAETKKPAAVSAELKAKAEKAFERALDELDVDQENKAHFLRGYIEAGANPPSGEGDAFPIFDAYTTGADYAVQDAGER